MKEEEEMDSGGQQHTDREEQKPAGKIKTGLRDHPPTVVGASVAALAAVLTDLRQAIDWGPLTDETVTLLTALVIGVAGGLIGKVAERYTIPYWPIEDQREQSEIEVDADELM